MKVYISGQITGLDYKVARENFDNAATLLTDLGMTPVNPMKGADQSKHWSEHMLRDIELLFDCDAIIMLRNWTTSRGARIEKNIAEECGMRIMYEKTTTIQDAIYLATGIKVEDYTTDSRSRPNVYARMLHAQFLHQQENMHPDGIAQILKRDRCTVHYYLREHRNSLKYNPAYREFAQKVDNIMLRNVSL